MTWRRLIKLFTLLTYLLTTSSEPLSYNFGETCNTFSFFKVSSALSFKLVLCFPAAKVKRNQSK